MVASYPNFFILLGPNCLTGHSSALFNSECIVEMMLKLLKPLAATLRSPTEAAKTPAPTVEVTQEAEDEWYGKMRKEMETRIWEMDGGIVRSLVLSFLSLTDALFCSPGTSTKRRASAPSSVGLAFLLPFLFPPLILDSASYLPFFKPSILTLKSLTVFLPLRSPVGPARVSAPNSRDQEGALCLVGLECGGSSVRYWWRFFRCIIAIAGLVRSLMKEQGNERVMEVFSCFAVSLFSKLTAEELVVCSSSSSSIMV
jgi:hypothetical protein